jgi:hypothetical protein
MTTAKMLKRLEKFGFEIQPDPEKINKWVIVEKVDPNPLTDGIVTSGDDRDDLILETYEGIFLGKYRI